MSKYLTEFIGTFFLVLAVVLTGISGTAFAPLAIGASLMVMVYMGGHISGAHYNPAVSLAVFIRGKLSAVDFGIYVACQFAGALAACVVAYLATGKTFAPLPEGAASISPNLWGALLVEIVYTFALALVVLNVATAKKTEGNSYYGLAIGFTVAAAAFAGGPISGGAFNPAVGVGPTIFHALAGDGTLKFIWIYLLGPLVGGVLAAVVFKLQEAEPAGAASSA